MEQGKQLLMEMSESLQQNDKVSALNKTYINFLPHAQGSTDGLQIHFHPGQDIAFTEWENEWTNEQTNEWMDKRTNKWQLIWLENWCRKYRYRNQTHLVVYVG